MKEKLHGKVSSSKELNGGGPQGSTFGIWEYLSQSNHNTDNISESDRFKFVDDLSFLEIIQLLIGGGVKGVIFKTEETTYQAILSSQKLNDW